jgi:hypothetical protein
VNSESESISCSGLFSDDRKGHGSMCYVQQVGTQIYLTLKFNSLCDFNQS